MADFQSSKTAAEIEEVLVGALTYKSPQALTESEKAFVRAKIGATELGEGIKIVSHFDSLEELEAAVPKPKAGEAYSIGTELPYNLYVYDFVHATWVNHGAIRANDIEARFAQNKAVTVDAWEEDADVFVDYTYKAAIPLAEVTGNDFPIVAFSPSDAAGGNFCPICFAFDGYVEIWANTIPTADIVIPSITFIVEDTEDGENGNSTKGITNATGLISFDEVTSLAFENITVPDWAWEESEDLSDYPIRAAVELPNSGVDADYFVDVMFEEPTANLAGVTQSYDGGFYIYAKDYPEKLVKIKSVICEPTKVNAVESKVFATIAVTYAEGKTVTCTNGATTLTAKTTSGSWQFGVPNAGEWVVSDGERSQTVSVTKQGQSESVVLKTALWLYNEGNEYTNITGGWGIDGYSGDAGVSAATKAAGYIEFIGIGNGYRAMGTLKAVDLTEKQTLYVDWQATSVIYNTGLDIYVTKTKKITPVASASVNVVGERHVDSIDISHISGEAFLFATAGWNPSCQGRIYRVWAE